LKTISKLQQTNLNKSSMKLAYVNGEFCPLADASISILDRGFLFADAVYEVTPVIEQKLIGFPAHVARLQRSLSELNIDFQVNADQLLASHKELIARNGLSEGIVYIQITRGAGKRDFRYDTLDSTPTVVMFTQAVPVVRQYAESYRYSVVTQDDLRWGRRDIKTTQLLYQSMAKSAAAEQGADDAWLIESDLITESTSSNAFIVIGDGTIVTRNLSNDILHGTTRRSVLECAKQLNLTFEERPFSLNEALNANEAFTTSASMLVNPVTEINGHAIGNGEPGPVTLALYDIYLKNSLATAM
jgi:D-alanine transaminase